MTTNPGFARAIPLTLIVLGVSTAIGTGCRDSSASPYAPPPLPATESSLPSQVLGPVPQAPSGIGPTMPPPPPYIPVHSEPYSTAPSLAPRTYPSHPPVAVASEPSSPDLALDPTSGDAMLAWTEVASGKHRIMYQRFPATGGAPGNPVQVATGSIRTHRASIGAAGKQSGYLVSWPDEGQSGPAIWSRWIDADGRPLSFPAIISDQSGPADEPRTACLETGCLTAWWDMRHDLSDVYGAWQSLGPSGAIGSAALAVQSQSQRLTDMALVPESETAWLTWPDSTNGRIGLARVGLPPRQPGDVTSLSVAKAGTAIAYPRVAFLAGAQTGCVAWVESDRMTPVIKVQVFDTAGQAIGTPRTLSTGDKTDRVLAVYPVPDKGFLVVWKTFHYEQVDTAVRAIWDQVHWQRLTSHGEVEGERQVIPTENVDPVIVYDANAHALVVAGRHRQSQTLQVRRFPLD